MDKKYEALFSPIKIGGTELKNRVILCAMGNTSPFGHFDYDYHPGIRNYYLDRAKGGVALIIPGVTQVRIGNDFLYEHEDVFLGPIKDLMDEIHAYGTKFFMQLGAGFGRVQILPPNMDEEMTHRLCTAPADGLPNVWNPDLKHRGLTLDEIHETIEAFGKTALLCKKAGIDGIEVHAVHEGYMLDQFAVANTNHRTDEYGGSLENRLRFACEIIKEVKKTCGEDFPVSVRYSVASKMRGFNAGALPAENYEEFGRTMEESPAVAQMLEAAGADLLNADNGSYDSWWWAHPPVYMPLHCNFPEVSYIKNFVNIPVFCAGRMEEPEFASNAIATGAIDGIGVARQFLADPFWMQKVAEGREDEIRPCIACHNACFPLGYIKREDSDMEAKMAHCALNPVTMEEDKWKLIPAEVKKNVAVVGGGIGGMESARLLKMRSHNVTLFEKSDELGGTFIAAAAPSFKEKDKMLIDWYKNQMKLLNIDIKMNTEATPEMLKEFDSVIVSTGATPRKLNVEGLESENVLEAIDYLRGKGKAGENVIVIGGGLTGIEIAYQLSLEGSKVTVVEMQKDILLVPGLCAANSNMLREIVRFYDMNVLTETTLTAVENKEGKALVHVTGAEGEKVLEADTVVISAGYVPNAEITSQFEKAGLKDLHIIGDAKKVGNLIDVIYGAYEVAYSI